ncbi:MAG: stealth family protein [Oscillospiraceae bacterium]|nr:stealth family protein [Oscillospiraceae bacterium]
MDYPIDIVIIWVDGNDPEWLEEKRRYSPEVNTDSRVSRYRDWDNLRYLFRGIQTFAPWVNNVFLVTCGHVPKWLNKEHPKLKTVKHEEYIPLEFLPTFSSHPIELNLHRINELSEHFVYFNDDMFLLKPTAKRDFFKNGKPCDSAVFTAHSHVEDGVFSFAQNRAVGILNKYFDVKEVVRRNRRGWYNLKYGKMLFRSWTLSRFPRFTGLWTHHLPTSLRKSVIAELWELEGDKLRETSSNRFRKMTDFNQWLFKDWQLATADFEPRSTKIGRNFFADSDKVIAEITDYIKMQKGKMICINDSEMNEEDFVKAKTAVNDSFEAILPEKSLFEV